MNVRALIGICCVSLSMLIASAALAGGLALVETIVVDNGDADGFADSNETVTLRFKLQNTTDSALNGVVLHLASSDHEKICITRSVLDVGELAPGASVETVDGFEFVVTDVDRTTLGFGALDDFSAGFTLTAEALPPVETLAVHPSRMRLDLDLDVAGGSAPATFFESFESGLGSFEIDNMDAILHGLEASDGFRCQYHDPDNPNSQLFEQPELIQHCHLGTSPMQADAVFWGMSGPENSPLGGRGFSGFHSMFWGIDFGDPLRWTTPMGVMEAAMTTDPIHLGWDSVAPVLSYKQQVSLIDGRAAVIEETDAVADPESAFDRGVVMVQLADETGAPVGDWMKLDPYRNVYDQVATDLFKTCMFDPIDDGTNEDDFFDPNDPERLHGPSSTCAPEFAFAAMGETSNPYSAENVGFADGPALDGLWGLGSWIETRFDLSRFRGRSIRVRFLATAMKVRENNDWQEYLGGPEGLDWNPNPGDDGWWIDDVTVEGALLTAASVVADTASNGSLPGPDPAADPDDDAICTASGDNCPGVANPEQIDFDLDGSGAACDCDDLLETVYPGAEEINDGIDNQCSGDVGSGIVDEVTGPIGFYDAGNKNLLSWPAQPRAIRYQVVRATAATFDSGCTLFPFLTTPMLNDTAPVFPGVVNYYLVRSSYPNVGSWGLNSSGVERSVACAP